MKRFLFLPIGFLLFQLTTLVAQSQNYQPIRDGLVYHYIARDSIYSLKISHSLAVGTNTAYYFNRSVKKGIIRTGYTSCIGANTTYHEQANNQFGEQMITQSGGNYIFRVLSGSTFLIQQEDFLIKTKIPVGHTWLINPASNLSATLVSKTLSAFNSVIDSVFNYTLSNGGQMKISKNYGFVQAPNFSAFVTNSDFKKRSLQLYKLPEAPSLNSINSPFTIFNYQPNDKFSYFKWKHHPTLSCHEEYYQFKILSRRDSPGGDTIYYTFEHQTLTKTTPFGAATPCVSSPTFTLTPLKTDTLLITESYLPETKLLTNEYLLGSTFLPTHNRALVSTHTKRVNNFNQREVLYFSDLGHQNPQGSNCGAKFFYGPDLERTLSYGAGLGKIHDFSINTWPHIVDESLQAYVKGNEVFGSWPNLTQIMAIAEEKSPLPFSVFPNPFASELNLTFGKTAGNTRLTLRNTLGQVVWEQEIVSTANSEVKVNLPELAKGLYILQASQNGKTFTTRLVKD